MQLKKLDSELLNYLIEHQVPAGERLPTLAQMSDDIGISVGKLREQLEVARSMGLVSVRPRLGTQREPFDFLPAIRDSALFGLATGEARFEEFSELRQAIETSMWTVAVVRLLPEDKRYLKELTQQAWEKLRGEAVHIPNWEHREFHLTVFKRLENKFVKGVLEAYWDIYEASELTRWASYQYWVDVWRYHEQIADAILEDDYERGRELLLEHFELLPTSASTVSPNGDGTG
jgi:DNA-binding FadR family transcriptional regulator